MMPLRLFEGVMLLLLLVMLVSEVLIPLVKGTRYFPHFRKATLLEKQVRKVEEDTAGVAELAQASAALREASGRLRDIDPSAAWRWRCPPCPHPDACLAEKICLASKGSPPSAPEPGPEPK